MKKYYYVIVRSTLGGLSNSISRLIVNILPLYPFLFVRHLSVFILSFFLYKKEKNLFDDFEIIKSDKALQLQIIISSLINGVGVLLFYNALKVLPVNIVSVFENGIFMLFTVILSVIFLKESFAKKSVIYLFTCIIGLILIITKGELAIPGISLIGLALLAINALLGAINSTITASSLRKISAKTNTAIKSIASSLTAIPMIIIYNQSFIDMIYKFNYVLIGFFIFSVFNTFFIKYFHSRSVQELNCSKTAIFTLMTPVLSSIFAMLIFKEWFNFYQYLGILFITFSVYKLK